MDIVNIIIFSTTALALRDRRVGVFCLLLILVNCFFSNSGPLAFMTGQDFLVRHMIEEVLIGSTAVWCIGSNWRGLAMVVLSMISLSYYGYEYYMWFEYSPTYQHFEIINQVLFQIIVGVLWIKSPVMKYADVQRRFRKIRKSINQLNRYTTRD